MGNAGTACASISSGTLPTTAIGATFTGPEVSEWLQAATISVVGKVPLEMLAHAVPAFPTRSEVWLYLMEALGLSGPCQRET